MKPSALVFLLVAAAACDAGPHIVVYAALDGRPVADLPLTLLPYDRNGIQDSLRKATEADAPEPPQDLLRELAGVDSALARTPADSSGMARADSLRQRRAKLAARVDSAQQRVVRWDSSLVAHADSIGLAQAEAAERETAGDTTDQRGRGELAATPGRSWIHARYVLPDAVIEWNVPVTLPAGQDSIQVRLGRDNARSLAQ